MRLGLAAGAAAAGLALAAVALTAGIGGGSEAPRPANVGSAGSVPAALPPGSPSSKFDPGRAVFARMGCGSCHTLAAAGSEGRIGPNLDERLPRHTRSSLIARIMMPPSAGPQSSIMPQDFGSRLNAEELDALVDFLAAAR